MGTFLEWATTNQLGLVWFATTLSVSVAEFVKDGRFNIKKLLTFAGISFSFLLLLIIGMNLLDWIISQF